MSYTYKEKNVSWHVNKTLSEDKKGENFFKTIKEHTSSKNVHPHDLLVYGLQLDLCSLLLFLLNCC